MFRELTIDVGLAERVALADSMVAAPAAAGVSMATAARHASNAGGRVLGTTLMGLLLGD
jgi:hypothetical protein